MALWAQRERVALGFGPDRVRMLVARGNGGPKGAFSGAEELPEGAVRAGLRPPALADDAVHERLERLAAEARGKGLLRRRPELVTLLLPDVSVKLAMAPVEGDPPGREEGERMARWALGDLLPGGPEEARIDWALMTSSGPPVGPEAGVEAGGAAVETRRWLVALGADRSLVREYEAVVGRLGWSVGRVVPWTLALAVAAGRATAAGRSADERSKAGAETRSRRLLLCEADGALACLFEAAEVPRFHRAWRARVPAERIAGELPGLRRYVTDRLELGISESWLCGPDEDWTRAAEEACRSAGLRTRTLSPDDAMLGGLTG